MAPLNFGARPRADIRNRILPSVDQSIRLKGLMVYGSRASGHQRPTSDWDVLALVESDEAQNFHAEFHGHIDGENGPCPLEMRIYSATSLSQLLERKDAVRLYSSAKGIVLEDESGILADFQLKARLEFESMISVFRDEILKFDRDDLKRLMQTALSEGRLNALHLAELGHTLTAHSILMDLITDFVIYSEIFHIKSTTQETPTVSSDEITNLYFLRRGRGGRFFNTGRYKSSNRMESLVGTLDTVLMKREGTTYELISSVFEELDRSFRSLTKEPLILSTEDWPETIVRPLKEHQRR